MASSLTAGAGLMQMPRARPWREMALAGLILLDLSWVIPWFRALTPATHAVSAARAFVVLGGILMASLVWVRLVNFLQLKTSIRQRGVGLLLVASILIGLKTLLYPYEQVSLVEMLARPFQAMANLSNFIPDEFLVTLIVILAWWRGIGLARLKVGPQEVMGRFQTAFFLMLGFVIINTLATGERLGNFVYLFIFAGLISLGAARISVLTTLRGGQRSPFDRRWFLGMLAATLGLLGLAGAAVSFVTGDSSILGGIVSLAWVLFVLGLLLVALPIVIVLLTLIEAYVKEVGVSPTGALQTLAEGLGRIVDSLTVVANRVLELLEQLGILRLLSWIPRLRPLVLLAILAMTAAAVIFLATLRIRTARERGGKDDERQSLLTPGELWRLLQAALQERLRRLAENMAAISPFRGGGFWAAARVRRIYRQMMDLSEELGYPRPEAVTPLEFLPTLELAMPLARAEARAITDAYQRVRYGELPETGEEVDEVEAAWVQIKKEGEEAKKRSKRAEMETGRQRNK